MDKTTLSEFVENLLAEKYREYREAGHSDQQSVRKATDIVISEFIQTTSKWYQYNYPHYHVT